jgi:uncharacterized protein involved in exopolysaccharide biosynthesis
MRFLSKFFKRWYLYMLPLIIFPVVGTVYAKKTLAVYESSAQLFFTTPADGSGNINPYLSAAQNGAIAMQEDLQIETFCVTVAQGTGLATQYDLSSQAGRGAATARIQSEISITPTAVGPNLVTVAADDKNALIAQQIVSSVISAFSSYYSKYQKQFDDQQIVLVQNQLVSARSQFQQDQTALRQYYQVHPDCINSTDCATTDPTLNSDIQAVQQDEQAVTTLQSKLTALHQAKESLAAGAGSLFQVVGPPEMPLSTTLHLKQLIVYPLIAFGAALALVLLIVGIQTFADRRVYSTQDLKALTEDMDLDIPAIESVPVLRGIGRQTNQEEDADGSLSGILLPVLTVLPQLGSGHMAQELRRVIGVTVEDEG